MSRDITNRSDEQLVSDYQNTSDKFVVGELFKRHSLMCFAVCNKYLKNEQTAEDAAMNIFEKLFIDLKRHEIKNFKSWLHTVCRNHCLMQLRKPVVTMRIEEREEENDNYFMQLEKFLHQDEREEGKEQKLQTLEKAILELKDKQRECIDLFYLQQKSYEEISVMTGYTLNEIKSHIQNGKRNLKITLSDKGFSLLLTLILWI